MAAKIGHDHAVENVWQQLDELRMHDRLVLELYAA